MLPTQHRRRAMKTNHNRRETQTVPKVARWTVPKRLNLPATAQTAPKVALRTVPERLNLPGAARTVPKQGGTAVVTPSKKRKRKNKNKRTAAGRAKNALRKREP